MLEFGYKMRKHMDRWPSPLTPPVTGWLSQAHVLGVSLFFHSYVVTIPSWVNEKVGVASVMNSRDYFSSFFLFLSVFLSFFLEEQD
jgi:hypothetical protein